MSEKKMKSKQAWCLNTVAVLKPFIERKEHITRGTAGKLVKPVTNWQRRELDILRKQANQIIRGENVSSLTYGIFGMTLDHPEMRTVRDSFDAELANNERSFQMPETVKIVGASPSEDQVFYGDGRPRNVNVGDVWVINRPGASYPDMLFIENNHTYVVIENAMSASGEETRAYRCIYPECVKVADVKVLPASPKQKQLPLSVHDLTIYPMHYAMAKEKEIGDAYLTEDNCLCAWTTDGWANLGPDIPVYGHQFAKVEPTKLNWVKNIESVDELPMENNEFGDMYGIMNGNEHDPDKYMVWVPTLQWAEIKRTPENDADIAEAQLKGLGVRFNEELLRRVIPQASPNPTRTNPRYTVWIADDALAEILTAKAIRIYQCSELVSHVGEIYFSHMGMWCRGDLWLGTNANGEKLYHGSRAYYDIEPYVNQLPFFKPYETIKELEASGKLVNGDAYVNQVSHIMMWANNEWCDMGEFHHEVGYIRDQAGNLYPKSRENYLREHLGCELAEVKFVEDWTQLPANPNKGDYYIKSSPRNNHALEAVFDGEVWIETEAPYHPIAIPQYEVWSPDPTSTTGDVDVSDKFEEPEQKSDGFWSRVGVLLGFK